MSNRTSFAIVVSAPSGTGKTTLCREVARRIEGIRYSVSCTTREKRPDELDGKDYRFIDLDTFKRWVKEEKFVEWATYQGSHYGTLREEFVSSLNEGIDVIADLEIEGARRIMQLYPDGVFVYILPPSTRELKRRLEQRHSEPAQQIAERLLKAEDEMRHAKEYTYVVVNKEFDKTVEAIISIVRAERLKSARLRGPLGIAE